MIIIEQFPRELLNHKATFMNWKDLEPKTVELRRRLSELTNKVIESSEKDKIEVPDSMRLAQSEIQKTDYDIVVCGEVKKGKSSFINAVIGEEILPTNTNVATSQVFRITNCKETRFELVFIDGSRMPIYREQLSRYGSQVDADINGEPIFKDKVLKYIQIYHPIEFLPQGVSLVDTPGLGALYAAHERITNSYVTNAAAVVFITDPSNPIVQQEKQFLEKVYTITSHVLYVMTKRDNYDENYIVNMVRRDEEILNNEFGKHSSKPIEVHPISSTLLTKAGNQEKDVLKNTFVKKSHFDEVKDKLLLMIYQTVGLSRTQFALLEDNKQVAHAISLISERKEILSSDGRKVYDELSAKRTQLIEDFNLNWGPNSSNQKSLNSKISEVCQGIENRLRSLFSLGNSTYQQINQQIDDLSSVDEAETFAEKFLERYSREIVRSWEEIVLTGRKQLATELATFNSQMDSSIVTSSSHSRVEIKDLTFMEKLSSFRNGFFTGAFVDLVLISIGIPPLGTIMNLITGFFISKSEREKRKLDTAKMQFRKSLQEAATKLQTDLCVTPTSDTGYSPLQKVVKDTKDEAIRARDEMFNKQKQRLENELKALKDDMEKDVASRKEALEKLKMSEQNWNGLQTNLTESAKVFNDISTVLVA